MADRAFSQSVRDEAQFLGPVTNDRRPPKLVRLLRLVILLMFSPSEVKLESLADELGISRRTLFRDLETLRQAGLPVEFDVDQRHYHIVGLPGSGSRQAPPPAPRPATSRQPRLGAWPFTWQKSVAILAAMRAADVPFGTEWRRELDEARGIMETLISQQFTDGASSVLANANQLLTKSHLSLTALYSTMKQFGGKPPAPEQLD